MITIEKAQDLVLKNSSITSKIVEVNLRHALGFVLAKDVVSTIDMPPFRESAMDGYALNIVNGAYYQVIGEIKAGDNINPVLGQGEAVRIFTGAPVPDTANTVIMQERVRTRGGVFVAQMPLEKQKIIRSKGEQIKQGQIAAERGDKIKGADIGFLTSLGVTKVKVYEKPSIAILVTGNKLKASGTTLGYGEIYESNSAMLSAVLRELGFAKTFTTRILDDYHGLKINFEKAIDEHDVVIATGGVSVGDYDFVRKVLKDIGVKEIFYRVNQKLGKPLFFGKKNTISIFGLPGNPLAALSCFYSFVNPLLKKSEGAVDTNLLNFFMPSLHNYVVRGDRAQYIKATIKENGVQILEGHGFAMTGAFGGANALVFLPENTTNIKKGQLVKTILLP